jgi:hypothetical protein
MGKAAGSRGLAAQSSVSPKRRRPHGRRQAPLPPGRPNQHRQNEAEYQYLGGPNLAIKVGQAGVSNSPATERNGAELLPKPRHG